MKLLAALCFATLASTALAQAPASTASMPAGAAENPTTWSVNQLYSRASKNIMAAADSMPEDKYSFKPTEGQLTFAGIVAHLANSNGALCAAISGTPAPANLKSSATDSKAQLTTALKASFAFCDTAVGGMTDAKLADPLAFRGGKAPRARVFIELAYDLADHYSQMASYLRLNSILPPSAQRPAAPPAAPAK